MPAPTADAVVIGAGVMGASIAFHLARAGLRHVAVLDKAAAASASTARSGALVRMHYTNAPETRLALASLAYFHHWGDLVGGADADCGFQRTGFAMLVGPANADRLRRTVAMHQALGVNTRVVTPDELRDLQPGVAVDDLALAAYEPDSGYADPVATTRALLAAAKARGAILHEYTPVTAIRVQGGRVAGVDTAAGPIDAPVVVCAAGCWNDRMAATAGVTVPITPTRAQIAFFRRAPALAAGNLVLIDAALGVYTRPHGGDLTLGGIGSAALARRVDPDAYDEHDDPDFAPRVLAKLGRRLPPTREQPYVRGHAGLYDISPDTRAIIDRAPGVAGLYLAAGFSGTGFKKSPAVGAGLAELIVEGQARTVDLHPFRYSRFAEGDTTWGDEYELPVEFGHRF
jgi:sarcosine oxidase subunit beta